MFPINWQIVSKKRKNLSFPKILKGGMFIKFTKPKKEIKTQNEIDLSGLPVLNLIKFFQFLICIFLHKKYLALLTTCYSSLFTRNKQKIFLPNIIT